MEPIQISLYIGISIIMLIFAFFLSASEISFVSIPSQRVSHLLRLKVKNAEILEYFKNNYHKTLTLVLSGQLISVIIATTLLTAIAKEFSGGWLGIVAIDIGMTIFALIFVQILPKKYGLENEKFALSFAPTLKKISKIMYPVILFFDKETTLFFKILNIKKEKERAIVEGELESMLKQSQMKLDILPEEKKMIERALAFNDVSVVEPMIPIVHVETLNINSNENKIFEILTNAKSDFIVVYDNNNIAGILNVKEGLKCLIKTMDSPDSQKSLKVSLKEILIAQYFVAKEKKVGAAFKEMKEKRLKFAMVIDENKKVKGIVKMEDMFEEIVGDV
ncbi:MAG: CNNM domain-containing protein [Candidatus Altarchaeum sp.]|nr:CNNM domain-containing protein [Candidatus Altarchaeum sp.]